MYFVEVWEMDCQGVALVWAEEELGHWGGEEGYCVRDWFLYAPFF